MRNFLLTLALVLATPALANEVFLGRITATTSAAKNQTDTAVPFTIPQGSRIVIDCTDGSGAALNAYIAFKNTTTGAVTAATSVRMASYWETTNGSTYQYLSVLGVTATVSCNVSAVY